MSFSLPWKSSSWYSVANCWTTLQEHGRVQPDGSRAVIALHGVGVLLVVILAPGLHVNLSRRNRVHPVTIPVTSQ
jgi:hypothetical protein